MATTSTVELIRGLRATRVGDAPGMAFAIDAMLFICRTGCQWRYLPAGHPGWGAVWQQFRRWRASGVRERAMARLAGLETQCGRMGGVAGCAPSCQPRRSASLPRRR